MVHITVNWVLWEMGLRIDKLKGDEITAIQSGDYSLAERLRIRREEYERFKFYIEANKESKHVELI